MHKIEIATIKNIKRSTLPRSNEKSVTGEKRAAKTIDIIILLGLGRIKQTPIKKNKRNEKAINGV